MNYAQMNKLNSMVYDEGLDVTEAILHLIPMKFLDELKEYNNSEYFEEWRMYKDKMLEVRKLLTDAYILREALKGIEKGKKLEAQNV